MTCPSCSKNKNKMKVLEFSKTEMFLFCFSHKHLVARLAKSGTFGWQLLLQTGPGRFRSIFSTVAFPFAELRAG